MGLSDRYFAYPLLVLNNARRIIKAVPLYNTA
jgi:hypothetical protein